MPEAVSRDGRSYAYATISQNPEARRSHGRVLIRDVRYGTDHEVWSGDGYVEIIGWGVDGLYFVHAPKGLGTGLTDLMVVTGAGRGSVQRVGPNPPFPKGAATGQLPLFTGRDHWISGAGVFTAFGSRPPTPSSNGSSPVAIDTITGMVDPAAPVYRNGKVSRVANVPDGFGPVYVSPGSRRLTIQPGRGRLSS